jgi:predicted nucleotidyltransferase component of viral defense system
MSDDTRLTAAIHDDPDLFVEAINYTSATTGFAARLIEKDYFASLLLRHLCGRSHNLVFKGGTCLSKVYWNFSRLSEDLDFAVSVPLDATRRQRRAATSSMKQFAATMPGALRTFRVEEPLRGFNQSTQYLSVLSYLSQIAEEPEKIKLEVGFREPLLMDSKTQDARTLLLDPVRGDPIVSPFAVRTIAEEEAYAEKARAALSRREPAVRDFYDFDYAVRTGRLDPGTGNFVALVRQKLAVPGNDFIVMNEERQEQLQRQVETELKPVLRPADFQAFDFGRAFSSVAALARRLE